MIGTVHLGMAVQALPVNDEDGVGPSRHRLVPALNVARLAKHRRPHGQELRLVRAVRRVAHDAVLLGRWMLPEERSALVGMAAIAFLVDGIRRDQLLRLRPMNVVATGALQARPQMLIAEQVSGSLELRLPDVLMAGEAHLTLSARLEERSRALGMVNRVAGNTTVARQVMLAPPPEHLVLRGLMALEAGFAGLDRRELCGILDFCRVRRLHMGRRVPVAHLTITLEASRLKLHGLAMRRGSE